MKNLFLVCFVVLIFSSCIKEELSGKELPVLTTKHKSLVAASNDFGLDLYQSVAQEEESDKNIILSPLSVSMALSMLLNGAENQTYDDLLSTLRLSASVQENNQTCRDLMDYLPNVDPSVTTSIANSIWYRENFSVLPEFLQVNSDNFDALVSPLDFNDANAKDVINAWVSNATNDKIESIIEEISSDDVMFLINAVYFNAPWKTEFDPSLTQDLPFYLANGSSVQVPMMVSNEMTFSHLQNNEIELINLPYGEGAYSFTAIMPNGTNDLASLESSLNASTLKIWQDSMVEVSDIPLYFPKFELEYELSLNDALSSMGMSIAFSDMADFSGINGAGGLSVSEVKHKTYMKVNEEGTEAAGATSIGIVVTSAPTPIIFNRPFLFVISEVNTGAIMFVGRIVNPLN